MKNLTNGHVSDELKISGQNWGMTPGLNTDIVVHKLPIKEECLAFKQKLRRTRPNMALKIREEVRR